MRRTPEERDLLKRAERVLPQGSLGNMRLHDDYAFVVRRGLGSRVWDVSGNEYVDYLLGSGPMVLGHAHPGVIRAVEEALSRGTTFFTQNEYAVSLAEEIVSALPGAEQVRFTTSGTEATFQALRLARAFRRRDKVLKFEGGFHGMHDYAMMSVNPSQPPGFPTPAPSSAGIPQAVQATVLVAPFNDIAATTDIIQRHHHELAAVIVEPVQRTLPPAVGFLEGLREVTAHYQVPLVFDEVVTGFRLAYGGAQEHYGVQPDLTALGKIVGGGFPLGAVTGRRELMESYNASIVPPDSHVPQIGTLSGNPVAAAAGLATLKELRSTDYDEFRAVGSHLKETLRRLLNEAEVPAQVSGVDTVFEVHFTDQPITDYRSTLSGSREVARLFSQTLLEYGVLKAPDKFYVGMCHTQADVQQTVSAFEAAVARVGS